MTHALTDSQLREVMMKNLAHELVAKAMTSADDLHRELKSLLNGSETISQVKKRVKDILLGVYSLDECQQIQTPAMSYVLDC